MPQFYYILKHTVNILISFKMANLKYLEFQRLIRELQFVESDYLYRSEIIKQSDQFFLDSVDSVLEKYPDLKTIWNENSERKIRYSESEIAQNDVDDVIDFPVKKLYRDIVKVTHPDKIKNKKLNELYIEATNAYESKDFVTIYKVCSELMISFDYDEEILSVINNKIEEYRNQISFLESTYTFKWLKSDDDEKVKVVLSFIENKIK